MEIPKTFSESFDGYMIRWNNTANKNLIEMKEKGLAYAYSAFQDWVAEQREAQIRLMNFLWTLEEIERLPADVAKGLSALCEFNK